MKKVICILLTVSLMLSVATPVFAQESEEPQYGTLKVEYSDALGNVEQLDVMVKDDLVYADAVALSDRLGYDCTQEDSLVSIFAKNNFYYPSAPLLAVHFYNNENKVAYNPLFGAEYEYTSPAPCIVDEKGIWVPLTYTLVLLGGNSTILEDTLLVQMPQNNVLSIAATIVNNEDTLSFDWISHFGYSETVTNITDGAGRVVTLFSGLLEFDGAAWLSLIDWDAFDRKFGKSLVTMLCSHSQEELNEKIWQVEAMLDLLSDDGKLGEMLRNKQMRIDSDVTAWQTACENYLKLMEDGSGSPAKYNLLYRQCERAMDQQMQFATLGGEGMIQIQDALSSATNALDIASIMGEVVSYMTEFQQTDEYLLSVLENYLNRRTETDYLPDATAQAMEHYLRVMDLGTLGYSAYSYIEENWLKCIVDESGLDALLGAPANALLFAWDIMSETIPFYSEGLEAVENREISNYAQKVQNDALKNLKYLIAKLKQASTISAEDCVQLSEYCYVYLKACYIARSSAIKSLDNTSEEFREQIKGKLNVEADINQFTVEYLSLLSSADAENNCYILGFLPENNEQYLNDYSTGSFSNTLLQDAISFGDQSENAEKQLTAVKVTENDQITRNIVLAYDEKGRICEITEQYLDETGEPYSVSVERYVYDAQGNLVRQESEYPEYTFVDEYVYDDYGNLVSSTIQSPGGWSKNTYEYDSTGRLIRTTEEVQIHTLVTEYTYNSDGILTGAELTYDDFGTGSVHKRTYEYDPQQRLVRMVTIGPDGTETEAYEYDTQGRQSKITRESSWGTSCRTFDYDYRPFVVYEYDDEEVYLHLESWTLYLGKAELSSEENGYLTTAVVPEWGRVYRFCYDNNDYVEEESKDIISEALVFDAFSDYGIRNDGGVNNYRIPKVNVSSEAADETNAVIYNDLYDGVYEKIENTRGNCGSSGIAYTWAENNGVISILTVWMPEDFTGHGPTYNQAYNISAETGALLTAEEVIMTYGYTLEEFNELAKERIAFRYEQLNEQFQEMESFKSDYEYYLEWATSEESLKRLQPYVSDSGDLCFSADIIFVGTYDRFTVTINLTGEAEPQLPVLSWNMPEEAHIDGWKELYIAYIEENRRYISNTYYSYAIAYVDNDNIPEIFLMCGSTLPGDSLLWISGDSVCEATEIGNYGIYYQEKQGMICTQWLGHEGIFADIIYSFNEGEITKIHHGIVSSGYDWDGKEVTQSQYEKYLTDAFDMSKAVSAYADNPIDTLIATIMGWQ